MTREPDPLHVAGSRGPLPTRRRYQKMVNDLLRQGGMTRQHADYKFFRVLLTGVCAAADQRNRQMRGLGDRLLKLMNGDELSPAAIASVREIGKRLSTFYVSPDMSAVRGTFAAMKTRVREQQLSASRSRSNSNLRGSRPRVTDEQIRDAEKNHRTRAKQADSVNLTERQLLRRLKKLNGG